jgi:MoaA/NifB/PqqE/SkfB family radical SAM enzyme
VLDQAEEISLNRTVAFTGGEPFLHYDFLKRLARSVQEKLGYQLSVSTNCFWAGSARRARQMLEEMQALGLTSLLISVDDFHQQHIALEKVKTAAHEAVDLGLACVFQCVETRTSRQIGWYEEQVGVPAVPDRVKWTPIPCDPLGRAAREIPESELRLSWRNQPGYCSMLRGIIINYDGRVTHCCGSANAGLPFIGNAFEEPLPDIVKRANADPLLNALAAWGGPYLLLDVLAKNGMPAYADRSYTSPCHACHVIFENRRAMAILQEALSSRRTELVAARLMAQAAFQEWNRNKAGEELTLLDAWCDDPSIPQDAAVL